MPLCHRWKTPLINKMDKTALLDNAQIDFSATTGIGGSEKLKSLKCLSQLVKKISCPFHTGHGGVLNPTYAANRVVGTCIYIYIYIYIEREREREIRAVYTKPKSRWVELIELY